MGFSLINDKNWSEVTMKIKYGGLRLTPVDHFMHVTFVAAWVHTAMELLQQFPQIADIVTNHISKMFTKDFNLPCKISPIGASMNAAIETLPPEYDDDSEPKFHTHQDLFSKSSKFQHCLSDSIVNSKAEELFKMLTSDKDKARVKSTQGKGSSAWLEAIPTSGAYAMNQNIFCLAPCLRLGLPMSFSSPV